jgi:hypothetical protein
MAVRVFTDNPSWLLTRVKTAIKDGSIETWSVDADGDFTHTPEQWKNRAWFRPVVSEDKLVFNILGPKSKPISRTLYGIYHGRLIEMFLTHFDQKFSRATATALPVSGDRIGGN